MKLRQKLAAVLAATMVVTAIPVTTMAASTNRITKTLTVATDSNIGVTTTTSGTISVVTDNAPRLVIDLQDAMKQDEIFTVKIADGEFLDVVEYAAGNNTATSNVEVTRISKNELQVKAKADITNVNGADEISIPLYAKAKGEQVKVTINPENSTVTAGEFVIATTNAAKASVEIGELTSFYTEGKVATMTIEEAYAGAFKAEAEKADNNKVEIQFTVENSEFEFTGSTVAKLGRGFSAKEVAVVVGEDKQVATITLDAKDLAANARGNVTVEGLKVKTVKGVKAPETGELQVSVSGKLVEDKAYTVAKVQEYGVSLVAKDEKAVEFVAGNNKEVKFTVKENVDDSIVNGRNIEFKLDNGYFTSGSTIKLGTETIATINDETIKAEKSGEVSFIVEKINEVKRVVGFEVALKADSKAIDKYEFTANVDAGVDFAGDIMIAAEGRAIGDKLEATIATVKAPFTVKTEAATLKVGLKDQKAGKIVITETEKGMLQKEDIIINFEQEKGMNFTSAPTVEVTGDIKVGKAELIKNEDKVVVGVKVPVTRTSKEASTVTISGFGIDVDRTVAEGNFDATIGGKAIAKNGTTFKAENFVVVGTPNTEDMVNGMKKGTASFTIGAKEYTVNGTVKEMDAAAYVTASGRTMLPIRFVSEAFGIDGNNIIFTKADGTITILAGNRTLQLKNGSNVAVLNGASIKMDEKVTIKDGRTYVPVGEVGRLLGVSVSFDNATKTATFTNK